MRARVGAGRLAAVGAVCWAAVLLGGCTRESVRTAITAQRRADQVQHAVFAQQHEALRILLYRDMLQRLERAGGTELSEPARAVLNECWNDRDLLEFWALQEERARALRLVGVDAQLASAQAVIDLLIKSVEARVERVKTKVAEEAAAALYPAAPAE